MPGLIAPTRGAAHASTAHLYFKPVPGAVVFATALLVTVLVIAGWYLIAQKCKKCDG